MISNFKSLLFLRLEGCSITILEDGICDLSNLAVLSLASNELNELPPNMHQLTNLIELILSYNNFTKLPYFLDMENETCSLPCLESIMLHGNPLESKYFTSNEGKRFSDKFFLCAPESSKLQRPSLIIDSTPELGCVYLGCYSSAKNKYSLIESGVKSILTVGSGMNQLYPIWFDYLQYEIEDMEEEDLYPFFKEGVEFIANSRLKGNVLVHCRAGISRSASLVIAYLIWIEQLSYEEAYSKVKQNREFIHPNKSFCEQLQKLANEVKKVPPPPRKQQCIIA